jgi:hypothetical protein
VLKRFTNEDRDIIQNLSAQNVGTSQILEYLAIEHGGKEHLRFKKKDVSNQIAADNRKLLGVDVDTTLMYFQKKQEEHVACVMQKKVIMLELVLRFHPILIL